MEQHDIEQSTKELIDDIKSTCGAYGLGNDGNEYKIIIQMFLYKYFNDKFAYEAKKSKVFGERLRNAKTWDAEYNTFTEDEYLDLFDYLPAGTPKLRPKYTISHLYNSANQGDFASLLDSTMVAIAQAPENADVFSMATVGKTKLDIFENITVYVPDLEQRDNFARALVSKIANPLTNFEPMFSKKYDFFSTMFEYLIKDYNKDGGGKYAEYYTPRSIAQIMARLLVGNDSDLRGKTCYDPSAGSGTLLMALAHEIEKDGSDRCTLYSQDISQKSSKMLRLNLILNNQVASIPNIIQGNTLTNPAHKEEDGTLKRFDYIVSNPPFKLDFPDDHKTVSADVLRFWAGVPKVPEVINPDKPKMEIYTCFIQHVIYSLKAGSGKGAIVVPTGFITAKGGIKQKILKHIVDEHIVYGCVSMPSNVFATTGTNVSVLFFDKSKSHDKVLLIDASKLGETYKDGNTKRTRLLPEEIEKIVSTFINGEPEDDFAVSVSYDEIAKKGYSLSAGQYFDIKIEYVDITAEEFDKRMNEYKEELKGIFAEGKILEEEVVKQMSLLQI